MNIISFSEQPKVLHQGFIARLSEANEAMRQLRRFGCRIVRLVIGGTDSPTEIIVDRNPHRQLAGCPNVHVTCGVRK